MARLMQTSISSLEGIGEWCDDESRRHDVQATVFGSTSSSIQHHYRHQCSYISGVKHRPQREQRCYHHHGRPPFVFVSRLVNISVPTTKHVFRSITEHDENKMRNAPFQLNSRSPPLLLPVHPFMKPSLHPNQPVLCPVVTSSAAVPPRNVSTRRYLAARDSPPAPEIAHRRPR